MIEQWRAQLLARVLRIVLALGVLVAVPSILFAVTIDRFDIIVVDVVALLVVGIVTFVPSIPYRVRALVLLAASYGLAVFFLGIIGSVGLIYLMAFPLLAALLLGLGPAIAALVVNAATLVGFGVSGAADPNLTAAGLEGPAEWVIVTLNLLFMNAVVAIACSLLLRRMERSLVDAHDLSTSLATRNLEMEHEAEQRRLAQQQQWFQAQLLDAVDEAVVATDRTGRIRYVNPAAERLHGWRSTDVAGVPLQDVIVPPSSHGLTQDVMARLEQGETWSGELDLSRSDGTSFPALVTAAPHRDESGAFAGMIAATTDISQLRETIDRLARSEEIRVAFLRATSHELRTPLTAIVGFIETLRDHDGRLDERARAELVERLGVNAGRLTRLITDLLDVDRLTSGLVAANRQPCDLRELVIRAVNEVDHVGRRIELDLAEVTGIVDGPKIERVVGNLVANAVRHTPMDAAIRVVLFATGDHAVVRVCDDGPGIDPGYLELIFEPFVQGPELHRHAKPGTGLGLSLARELVRLHDGEITASNGQEQGACFEVRLPTG